MQNEILIVLDSVGYDEFMKAKTPNFDKIGETRKAYSLATYTMPSVYAMWRGMLPQPELNYTPYKRYTEYSEHSIIPLNMTERKFNTYLVSANPNVTMKTQRLRNDIISYHPYFRYEHYNYDSVKSAGELFEWFLHNKTEPFYSFFILIETHTPYLGIDRTKENQIKAIEEVDKCFGEFIEDSDFKNETRIIITSDHSEAWDEDVNNGHNPRDYFGVINNDKIFKKLITVFNIEGVINDK